MISAIRERFERFTGNDASQVSFCPDCGAGASEHQLISGGQDVPDGFGARRVRMQVLCRACGTLRTVTGDSTHHNGFYLQVKNQPRRRTWR